MNNLQTLAWLCEVNGDGRSYRQGSEQLNVTPKVGNYYAVPCADNPDYYLVVAMKKWGLTEEPRLKVISNPTYGVIPSQYEVLTPQQAMKFMRLPNTTFMNAFPYKGVSGQ